MSTPSIHRRLPWHALRTLACAGLLAASLAIHGLVVLSFIFRWDKAALVTTVPFPLWCGLGLALAVAAALFRKTALTRFLLVVWTLSLLLGADERHGLPGWGRESPSPGPPAPHQERPVLRLITFNALATQGAEAARAVIPWQPDIVLLQEAPWTHHLRPLAVELFGGEALLARHNFCAILARGRQMQRVDFLSPGFRPRAVCARLILPDGRPLDLLNVHLPSASRDTRFWRVDGWRAHYHNRRERESTLAYLVNSQANAVAAQPRAPSIIAGDFNAPAGDGAVRQLMRTHFDTYPKAGRGIGNTYPSAFPLQRIDQVWMSPELTPVRHGTAVTRHSDHRMVVVDFVYGG